MILYKEEIIVESSLRKTEFFYDLKVGLTKMNALHTYNESAESTTDFIIISGNLFKKGRKKYFFLTNSNNFNRPSCISVLLEK